VNPVYIKNRGATLFETLIYTSLFGIVASIVMISVEQTLNFYSYARIRGDATEYAQQAALLMKGEIRNASSVYAPTSVFANNSSQLSLETTNNLPADELVTFVDFYLDGNRLFRKREGLNPELLVGGQFIVPRFIVTHLNQTSTSSALRIELTVLFNASGAESRYGSTTIVTTASLRSY
jgi:hypothetical protein